MTQQQTTQQVQAVLADFAQHHGLDAKEMGTTLVSTIFPSGQKPTAAQVYALLIVAKRYELDPFLKEIYAFPAKGGGIIPIVSIDGWLKIINRHPQLDGIDVQDISDDKHNPVACEVTIHRKDRKVPVTIREYISECSTGSGPWKKQPARMIRHRALIQAARYAFSLAGIYDPEEAQQIRDAQYTVTDAKVATGGTVDALNAAISERAGEVKEEHKGSTIVCDVDGQQWEEFMDSETGELVRLPVEEESK